MSQVCHDFVQTFECESFVCANELPLEMHQSIITDNGQQSRVDSKSWIRYQQQSASLFNSVLCWSVFTMPHVRSTAQAARGESQHSMEESDSKYSASWRYFMHFTPIDSLCIFSTVFDPFPKKLTQPKGAPKTIQSLLFQCLCPVSSTVCVCI